MKLFLIVALACCLLDEVVSTSADSDSRDGDSSFNNEGDSADVSVSRGEEVNIIDLTDKKAGTKDLNADSTAERTELLEVLKWHRQHGVNDITSVKLIPVPKVKVVHFTRAKCVKAFSGPVCETSGPYEKCVLVKWGKQYMLDCQKGN